MLRNKHLRLVQDKIARARRILRAKTETETLDLALDRIIQEEQEKTRKKKVMGRILALRNTLGKMEEDPADWIRAARKERAIE
jgi:hypothetical protein